MIYIEQFKLNLKQDKDLILLLENTFPDFDAEKLFKNSKNKNLLQILASLLIKLPVLKKNKLLLNSIKNNKYFLLLNRQNIDARKADNIFFVYNFSLYFEEEKKLWKIHKNINNVFIENALFNQMNVLKNKFKDQISDNLRPVIVGSGPCGLFAALLLAKHGLKPIIIEQGEQLEERKLSVSRFWKKGILNEYSNVQYGEGGAGTFSDGKLSTSVKSPLVKSVLSLLAYYGANADILFKAKAHIGTDSLKNILINIRNDLLSLGTVFYFNTKLLDFQKEGSEYSLNLYDWRKKRYFQLKSKYILLAAGNSARDLYRNLIKNEVALEVKDLALGLRLESSQRELNECQYSALYEDFKDCLPTATYRYSYKTSNQRGVYSFCMCPGGLVVSSSSHYGQIVSNGMSRADRNSRWANAAILVNVKSEDFEIFGQKFSESFLQQDIDMLKESLGNNKVIIDKAYKRILNLYKEIIRYDSQKQKYKLRLLYPILWQEYYEFKSFVFSLLQQNKPYVAPAQTLYDFLTKDERLTTTRKFLYKSNNYSYRPGLTAVDLQNIMPDFVYESLFEALPYFIKALGIKSLDESLLIALESRSSAPLRILRDNVTFESLSHENLFPAGEGAGYAGGISSAALDGLKVASACISKIIKEFNS